MSVIKDGLYWYVVTAKSLALLLGEWYRYRKQRNFLRAELLLWLSYLMKNPYQLCRRFFAEKDLPSQPYGETPLLVLEKAISRIAPEQGQLFLDLGCGRGRLLFWASDRFQLQAKGVEINPTFCTIADQVVSRLGLDEQIIIAEASFLAANLHQAKIIYCYAAALEQSTFDAMIARLSHLSTETWIISVSDPLNSYLSEPAFETFDAVHGQFLWGKTTLFLQKPLGYRYHHGE